MNDYDISAIIGEKSKIGVLTANSACLDAAVLAEVGVADPGRLAVAGLQEQKHFFRFAIEETGDLDADAVEAEMVSAASTLVQQDPSVKAILLECSLLPPYAAAVQAAVRLPVFDYVTMINHVFSAVVRRKFVGYL